MSADRFDAWPTPRAVLSLLTAVQSGNPLVLGWDLSGATLSKIEAQLRCVTDREAQLLAEALGVPVQKLYPVKAGGGGR